MKTYSYQIKDLHKRLIFTLDNDDVVDLSLQPETFEPELKGSQADKVFQQIVEYLNGTRKEFSLSYQLNQFTDFQQTILRTLTTIKYGETITYRDLALLAGYPKAARAVGSVMAKNPLPLIIPCHRVIRSDAKLGEYSMGGPDMKRFLLNLEQNHD